MSNGMFKGLKRVTYALLLLLALYSLLGFLILPGIGLRVANQQLAKYSSVPAHIERMELNPFSLELTVWGLHIGTSGAEQIGFERLYANLKLDSLWTRALHLTDLQLDKPNTEVLFAKDGTLNLTQLFNLPPGQPATPPSEPAKPFPLRLDHFQLVSGRLHFRDLRPSQPTEFLYDALDFQLNNLSTLPEDNAEMTLVAAGPNGGQIDWKGRISLVPITSTGHLQVTDLQMKSFWPYVRDAVPLELKDGVLNLAADYSLNLAKDTQLQLNNVVLAVAPLNLQALNGRPLLNLAKLEVSDTSLDLATQQVKVGKVRSEKLETWAAREADGQIDWQKLFAGQPVKAVREVEPSKEKPPAAAPAKPWQVLLADVQLRDYQVHLTDRSVSPQVAIDVGPLNVDVVNFDSLNGQPFNLRLDTGLGRDGKLKAEGTVNLNPVSAQLKVATTDADLRIAQAYITPFIRLELRSGMLDSDLAVNLKSIDPLALNVSGRAQIEQLHTLDTLKQRDFLKWQELALEGLDFELGQHLQIAQINLKQPYTRFMINEDHTTNINDLLVPQPADKAPAPASQATPAAKPMAIRIGGIDIQDGSANFADFSLQPNFATAIQQLNGKIGTLDNSQAKIAGVDIQGKVDRYAPVTIKGELMPFDPLSSLDIATSFKRVELTTLTPYSGKFAGYRIRKGRLNLDLHYRIVKGLLNAENKVVVEELELGDKVDSPDAVSLPIRLAVALLKDTDGKISIELPVTGNLNDPQFNVMPIVWQTLRNLVVRAAAAPFKFIGGLISGGSDVDLSSVGFAAGSSTLDPAAQKSLNTLAEALKKRPVLRLEVEGSSAQSADGPLIAQQRLEQEYQNTWYTILQKRGDKVPANARLLQVPDSEKAPLLEGIYRARLKEQPDPAWAKLGNDERTGKLRQGLIDYWSQSEQLLRELGQARGIAIKAYLVDKTGLSDDRVFLLDANPGAPPPGEGKVLSPLHLDSE